MLYFKMKRFVFCINVLQGRHIKQLISLGVFVIEASCLQFLNGQ